MTDLDDADDSAGGGLPGFLLDPVGVVRRRWVPMAVTFTVAAVIAVGVVTVFPERFEAVGRLLISPQSIPNTIVQSTITEGVLEHLNAMVGEVTSSDSLLAIAAAHGLDHDVPEGALLYRLSEAIEFVPDDSLPQGKNPGAMIFAVKVTWDDPDHAADVANELMTRVIDANLERRSRQARLATTFLRKEMERAESALKEQAAKISAYKEAHRGELPSELPSKMARLERLQSQRSAIGIQISEAESRLMTLQTIGGSADPRVVALQEVEQRLLREKTINTPEHPNVVALQRQVETLRAEISTDPGGGTWSPTQRAGVQAAQREVATLRAQVSGIDAEMAALEDQVGRTPAREEGLASLEQRERVLSEAYAESLRKVKGAELAESLELSQQGIQVSRLEPAFPPGGPKLPLWQLAGGALLAVLGLTALCGLFLELRDPVILAVGELEALTGMKLLGDIPKAS